MVAQLPSQPQDNLFQLVTEISTVEKLKYKQKRQVVSEAIPR